MEQRQPTELQEVVRLNERIKEIVEVARSVNMTALNAMLAARRAGVAVSGFSVVSVELRRFATQIEKAMRELTAVVFSLVQDMAWFLRQRRMGNLMLAASHKCADGGLDKPLLVATQRGASIGARLRQHRQRIAEQARGAIKLCQMGRQMARTAKVEAVHGGALAADLRDVAENLETTIENIMRVMSSIGM